MVEGRRKTALQRHAAQAVGLSRGSAGFSFELSAWFCVGAWVRVVGAWTAPWLGSGLSFGLLLY